MASVYDTNNAGQRLRRAMAHVFAGAQAPKRPILDLLQNGGVQAALPRHGERCLHIGIDPTGACKARDHAPVSRHVVASCFSRRRASQSPQLVPSTHLPPLPRRRARHRAVRIPGGRLWQRRGGRGGRHPRSDRPGRPGRAAGAASSRQQARPRRAAAAAGGRRRGGGRGGAPVRRGRMRLRAGGCHVHGVRWHHMRRPVAAVCN